MEDSFKEIESQFKKAFKQQLNNLEGTSIKEAEDTLIAMETFKEILIEGDPNNPEIKFTSFAIVKLRSYIEKKQTEFL